MKLRAGSPEGRLVEASVRPHLVFGKDLKRLSLRDLQGRHALIRLAAANSAAIAS
ncbi:hypothetical protein D3C83_304380 [compost metagenome]